MKAALLALMLVSGGVGAAMSEYVAVIDFTALTEMDAAPLGIDPVTLGYPAGKAVPGVGIDLNADGTAELLLRGGSTYCGTGGCTFFLFDGRTGKSLGSVFGSTLIVHATSIGGWSVLAAFARGGAFSGTYATFVHDGTQYTRATAVALRADSMADLFNSLRTAGATPFTAPASARPAR